MKELEFNEKFKITLEELSEILLGNIPNIYVITRKKYDNSMDILPTEKSRGKSKLKVTKYTFNKFYAEYRTVLKEKKDSTKHEFYHRITIRDLLNGKDLYQRPIEFFFNEDEAQLKLQLIYT